MTTQHYGQVHGDVCNFQGPCPACTENADKRLTAAKKFVRNKINEWEYYGEHESLIPHLKTLLMAVGD